MRYRVVAVGQLKRGFYADGCGFYLDRLGKIATVELIEVRDGKDRDVARRTATESAGLLARVDGKVVVLDERGRGYRSEDMAAAIGDWESQAVSRVSFLIGGADGHTDDLRDRADAVWRLSDLTMPHELARLVLLEQLYRVETIRSSHPYHRA